jgi:tRNA-dihydrouridine synthase A
MMDWTDRHCRVFHRQMTRRAMLYTEMVTAAAVIHGPKPRLLDYSPMDHPVALQLGGSDPRELAEAVKIANAWAYDEINLNCGCPSDRVQSGCFGAVLMERPTLVADCFRAMQSETDAPVTPTLAFATSSSMRGKHGCKALAPRRTARFRRSTTTLSSG